MVIEILLGWDTHVHSSTIHNSQNVKTAQVSINGGMDKKKRYIHKWSIIQP